MTTARVYEMTKLTSEVCEVTRKTALTLQIVYGDVLIDMVRESTEVPFIWKMGDLQLMTTGEAERPLPQFRPLGELLVAIRDTIEYRKTA